MYNDTIPNDGEPNGKENGNETETVAIHRFIGAAAAAAAARTT